MAADTEDNALSENLLPIEVKVSATVKETKKLTLPRPLFVLLGFVIVCLATMGLLFFMSSGVSSGVENERNRRNVAQHCNSPYCLSDWTPVPNMAAALEGYDPMIGNDLVRANPGKKKQIFEPTEPSTLEGDLRYNPHPSIDYVDDLDCRGVSSTEVFRSFQELQRMKSKLSSFSEFSRQHSSVREPGFPLIPGPLLFLAFLTTKTETKTTTVETNSESDFLKERQFFTEENGEIYSRKVHCFVYRIEISRFTAPRFRPAFVDGMRQLNKAARNSTSHESQSVLKGFIEEFGTYYMRKAWLGATLITEATFSSQAVDEEERKKNKACFEKAFLETRGRSFEAPDVTVGVEIGPVTGSTTVGGWKNNAEGYFRNRTQECLQSYDQSGIRVETSLKKTSWHTIGALPNPNEYKWAADAKNSPSVVKRELEDITELFKPEWIGDILLDENDPAAGFLDARVISDFVKSGLYNYCQLMLGKSCKVVKGCGISGICNPGETCEIDISEKRGFKCLPRLAANGEECINKCEKSSEEVHWKEGWIDEWTGWNQNLFGADSDDRPYVRNHHYFKEYHRSPSFKCTTRSSKKVMHCGPREGFSAKGISCQNACERRNRSYFHCDVGTNKGFEVETKTKCNSPSEKWTAGQDYCLPRRRKSTSAPRFVLAANGERCAEECTRSSAVVNWRDGWTGQWAGWNRKEIWRFEEDRPYVSSASYFREYHRSPSYKCETESGRIMYCGVEGGVSATGIPCLNECKHQHSSLYGIKTNREYYYCDVGRNNGFEVQQHVHLDLSDPKEWTAAEDFCSPMESRSVQK